MDYRDYKIASRNSTVCGYPGRNYDWSKFCWDGSEVEKELASAKNNKSRLPAGACKSRVAL